MKKIMSYEYCPSSIRCLVLIHSIGLGNQSAFISFAGDFRIWSNSFTLPLSKISFPGSDMLFLTQSASVYGIDALIVDIEVNLRPSTPDDQSPAITIVGLPDT